MIVSYRAALLLLVLGCAFAPNAAAQTDAQPVVFTQPPANPVQKIDQMIEQVWTDYELKPSPAATDGEWCRRVYLDLIGRIPSVKELRKFIEDDSPGKRSALVETLLYDDAYTEEFARNWTTIWTNLLIGRTGGTDNNTMISRAGLQKYLRDTFARGKPYNKMVHELISATGSTNPSSKDFNGATNFLIEKVNDEDGAQATAQTSKLFLGLQVQCTQCHNHPFNDWKQQKYWEMNAFFRQARAFQADMTMGPDTGATLTDQDFRGENGDIENAALFYELRNGLLKVAYPVFVDGTEVESSGYVNVVNRREKLADLVISSEYFPKVIANRMWAHFLGYGFTKPIDDLGPHNTPNNEELLDYLGQEFKSSGFDLRQLMTWIVLSKPYSLSSKRNSNNKEDDPLLGESPKFSHYYLRQMRAEELYESLQIATMAGQDTGSYEQQEQRKSRWLQQFSSAFGTDEGDETTTFNGTIPQVLMMFNGEMIKSATDTKRGTLINSLLSNTKLDDGDKIEYLFEAGLARKPTRDEIKLANSFLTARGGNKAEALRDIWWVILNTNEFIFNH
jgi:hypothetical protein